MRLGVFTTVYRDLPVEQVLDTLAALGVQAVELGTGNWPGDSHCPVDELLADQASLRAYRRAVESRGLVISALSQHGNPVHPDPDVAAHDHDVFLKTLRLAELLEVPVVNAFSGCPGDGPEGRRPNWVTCAWPPEFADIERWQWTERLVPYWQEQLPLLERHGVRVGIELHPGQSVYNVETFFRLRATTGAAIGVNFDPSHLFWQGVDPFAAVKALGNAICHVHAKDTFLDQATIAVNGVLDTKSYADLRQRSWYFRSVGFGHGRQVWADVMSALRLVGFDHVVSIEHEDPMLSADDGLAKAVEVLRPLLPASPPQPGNADAP
jgi:sugar phosphate isomerase/epimerase